MPASLRDHGVARRRCNQQEALLRDGRAGWPSRFRGLRAPQPLDLLRTSGRLDTASQWCQQERPALDTSPGQPRKRREILLFLFITVVLFPVLSVMIVGGYGFAVWIYQMIAGPPGPPVG